MDKKMHKDTETGVMYRCLLGLEGKGLINYKKILFRFVRGTIPDH